MTRRYGWRDYLWRNRDKEKGPLPWSGPGSGYFAFTALKLPPFSVTSVVTGRSRADAPSQTL